MSVTPQSLIQPKFASTTANNDYAAQARTLLDKFTVTNVGATTAAITIWVVPPAASVGNSTRIISQRLIAPNETFSASELAGHVIENGSGIWCQSTATNSLVLFASGRIIA
jgi:hypothetical protein